MIVQDVDRRRLPLGMHVIFLIAILLAPAIAPAAVTLTARGTDQNGTLLLPGHFLSPGDQVTVEVTARSDGELTSALGASATGYDSNGFQFNSGRTVASIFNVDCFPGPGCFGGLDNSFNPVDLEETTTGAGIEVQFFNAVSVSGTAETGAIDLGVSGVAGDPQVQIVFDVVAATVFNQQASINIGSLGAFGDALVLGGGAFGTVITVWVVPEPGTGLLVVLGLTGLSVRRPREASAAGGSTSV